MKSPLLFVLLLTLSPLLRADSNSLTSVNSVTTSNNPSIQTVDIPTNEPDGRKYSDTTKKNGVSGAQKLADCKKRVDEFKDKPCDVIFIGDSITQFWLDPKRGGLPIWNEKYAPRHSLDFAIAGDSIQNVLWRLNNMGVDSLKPKVAVIMIGTNNRKNSPKEIADGVKAVIAKTQGIFPGVKIILVSILPSNRLSAGKDALALNDRMMATDAIIKDFADSNSIYWLDLVPMMPPIKITTPDGSEDINFTGLGADKIHPDGTGYKIWADSMEPILQKLLSGKT